MRIGDKVIGKGSDCFIIAELSANHGGSLEVAKQTIRAAARTGADAIKLQTYTPDTITIDCDNSHFTDLLKGTIWEGRKFYDLYTEAYTPWEWHAELFQVAAEEGLVCFSSPFDKTAIDLLEELEAPAYKIASFEITDIPLIEYAASKGKPIIISTGIAGLDDIEAAVSACRNMGNNEIVLLKCTSAYPAKVEDINLHTMPDLAMRFGVISGLSDHTLGISVPVAAVALGASVIEKHFIIDKSVGGPDASFSLDENEFTSMVKAVRDAQKSLGQISYEITDKIKASRRFARSLFVVMDVEEGETFTPENVRSIRPFAGLHPAYYHKLLGKTASRKIKRGEPFSLDMLQDADI